jgi:hypothetical protein
MIMIWTYKKIIRNIVHTNPCVCDFCLNQSFLQLQFQLYFVAHGKMPYNHIFNYNIIISYWCDYNLQLLLIGWKWRWKMNFSYHSQLMVSTNIYEILVIYIYISNVLIHRWLNNMWHFLKFEFWLYFVIIVNVHVLMVN